MRTLASLALLVAACSSTPPAPPSLSQRLGDDRARAGVIASEDELIGGPTAVGARGDFKLYNSKIQVIVEKPGPSDGYDTYGGLVVDADVIRAPGEKGRSRFGEAIPVYNFRTLRGVSAEVVHSGVDGGPAQVRVKAVDDAFPLIEAVLGQNRPPMGLEVTIDYVLDPGADFLRIITTLKNPGAETVHIGDQYVGYVMGDGLQQFLTGHGFAIPDLPRPAPYYAAVGEDVSYSFITLDSEFAPVIQFQGFLLGALNKFVLAPGTENSIEVDLVVGAGDLAAHERTHRAITASAGRDVAPTVAVAGTVRDSAGKRVSSSRVHVVNVASGDYLLQTLTDAAGAFRMELPPARYRLQATANGRDMGASREVDLTASAADVALEVGGTGTLEIKASADGEPVPAKVLLSRQEPPVSPPAAYGEPPRPMGYERVEFIPAAGDVLPLPPGRWSVVVSRGFEYELVRGEVEVKAGERAAFAAELSRSVDTRGWLGGDYHVHAQWSPDSDDLLEHKALAFAGEGLELPVSTEHEYIGDFQPVIERLGLSKWVHGIVGEEVSTTSLGHFNTFPLERDPLLANFGAMAWYGMKGGDLMKAMRAHGTGPLVQVNHPRSGSFGAPIIKGYFTAVGFDPATFTVRAEHDWSTDYDAIEIANGGTPDYDDWFPFLDRGFRMLGTGDSDSHVARSEAVGYPRNYVDTGTDTPEGLDVAAYMTRLRAGRLTVSGGYFVTLGVGEQPLGALLPASAAIGGKLGVQVKVQAPAWVPAGTLELVLNGRVVASRAVGMSDRAVRLVETIELELPADADSWLFARVVSPGRLDPVYPGAPAFGFTNPLYVDTNGNGRFDARVR